MPHAVPIDVATTASSRAGVGRLISLTTAKMFWWQVYPKMKMVIVLAVERSNCASDVSTPGASSSEGPVVK